MNNHAERTELYRMKALRKDYNGRTVLHIGALSIRRGEILAVVGPSGSGKSTLLRLLNFLEPASAGELHFDGRIVPTDPPLATRRMVTTVFQSPQLLNRSVSANVAFGLRVRGGAPDNGNVLRTLKRVGMTALAHSATRTLSGGERQRVALARALVLQPEVLLLDEPTANLDPYNVSLIESLISDQHRRHAATVVLVTHNVFQARRLAQRCALLLDGKLVEVAPTETFFEAPADSRVAAFVSGQMVY
ncbi:MAG: phosphate ABC transporter ATP-binding protein [Anaerolineales bacterium]|jgi:tungstate transport system ATP-binding protein|nr:phosphate ABC transporter ATP-binding protein [Anaerolineales bacterium]